MVARIHIAVCVYAANPRKYICSFPELHHAAACLWLTFDQTSPDLCPPDFTCLRVQLVKEMVDSDIQEIMNPVERNQDRD